ncbi:uncharacterized protein LOC112888955 isoform X2 [Panicum hallii]|uniref:uncharacterized protein LOC112888955 isoform X2 n=1 Tax=Panicum hallii TaxID=206008 RepID=UPI000DF4EFA1|nr:uncharacterized protein LOC112888955 isoform X2 [Panicum hallii]
MQRDIWRSSELIRLVDTSNGICMRELRIARSVFYKLCSGLRDRGLLLDTFHVSVEEQVAMFLKIVGQCHTHSSVAIAQWRSGWTVSSMVKKNKVGSADVVYREKYKTWTDDSTEFMLQWYVDYQKDKPATFRWKQHHHHLCVEALNARFGIGATRHQAYRQFRALKEKWNWISQALAKSGNGFDAASRKFNLPYSEKPPSKLGLMEELFGESGQANGSLAIDQYTSDAEDDRSETETDDSFTVEHGENNSDTIARSNSPDLAFSSSLKHKNMKSPMKKLRKHKEKRANALENDKIASSIVMLANSVASTAPAPADPYANLWKRIEDIPFPPRDKVDIATFLSKPEQMYLRNYLNAASDQSFGSWVTDYLGA